MNSFALVAVMAVGSLMLRGLPFVIFRKHTPPYIAYLGKVLPPALIGMLVVYCLKDLNFAAAPYGLPELIAAVCVVVLHLWRRSSILSILGGTAIYMLLVQFVF